MSKKQQNQSLPLNNAQFAQQQAQFPQFQQQMQGIPNQPNISSQVPNNPFGQMPAYPQPQNATFNQMMNQQQVPNQFQQPPFLQQQQYQLPQQQYQQHQQHQQYQQMPLFGSNYQQQPHFVNPVQPQNIKYNDDDEIHPMDQKIDDAKQAIYDLVGNLEFSINAQYKMGKLKKDQIQYLPAMVTLKAKDEEENNNAKQAPKVGVDLICIIDRSGSMQGQKIQMVKQTLKLLLNFLTEKDRLCLIQFDNDAQRLTTLQKVTTENKIKIEKTIDKIQANGGTVISTGTHIAFEQIQKRKYRNNVTSIFMLSDGQDGSAEQAVKAQIQKFDDPFTIHSFGFGQDHDAKMMTSLCNLKNGSFYFVNDISLLDEFFVDALGGLVSVVGENIEISVKLITQAPFEGIKISKTYGKMWQKVNDLNYKINIPQIASGSRKDYVFEFSLPKFEGQIGDHQRVASVVNAIVTIKSAQTGQIVTKQATLDLTFFNENEQLPVNEEDIDVAAQYYRVKGADVIDDARRACEQNQHQNAQVMIDSMITTINRNQKVAKASEGIIQDLSQAKQATQPQNFQKFGQQQMCQMASNNYAQAGINANFNAIGMQQQQIQPAQYQNKCQTNWVGQVQMSKKSS